MLRIRKVGLMAGMLLLSLLGCKKKQYTCGFSFYYPPAYVAFKGFSVTDLNLVVLSRYTAGTGFSDLQGVDSIDGSAALFEGDVAYNKENYGFFTIISGVDYKIRIPQTGKEFLITEITKPESGMSWVQNEHCATGSGQALIRQFVLKVDGREYALVVRKINNFYVYLEK